MTFYYNIHGQKENATLVNGRFADAIYVLWHKFGHEGYNTFEALVYSDIEAGETEGTTMGIEWKVK